MKAITVRQPWASLVAAGVKTIETRSWATKYRGPLAIHAGKATPDGLWEGGDWAIAWEGSPRNAFAYRRILSDRIDLPLGAVVATCTLADVVPVVSPRGFVGHTIGVLSLGEVGDPDGLWEWWPAQDGGELRSTSWHNRTDQRPLGDFTPGRYAWLLTDVTPLADPIPAKGRLGLWDWEADR